MPIVRHGHAKGRSLPPLTASLRGPRRQATMPAAALRSRALTIRHPPARIRRRELIPRRAVATRLRHAPPPRQAAVLTAAAMPAVAAEARTAAEAPALTATANLFATSKARPALPGGPFSASTSNEILPPSLLVNSPAAHDIPAYTTLPAGWCLMK